MLKKDGFQALWRYQLFTYCLITCAAYSFAFFTENQAIFMLSEFILLIPCAVGYYILKRTDRGITLSEDMGIRGIKPIYIPYILFMPVFYQIFCIYTTFPLAMILNILFGSETPDIEIPKTAAETALTLISLCVAAPLTEEFIFRGVMVRLMKGYSFQAVMLTTSLAFAMTHMDMSGFVQLFFMGALLFMIRVATGSLFASVAAHSIVNLGSFLSMFLVQNGVGSYEALILAFEVGSIIIIPFLFVNFLRVTSEEEAWTKGIILKGKRLGVSVACIIFTVVFLILNAATLIYNIQSGYVSDSLNSFFNDVHEEDVN